MPTAESNDRNMDMCTCDTISMPPPSTPLDSLDNPEFAREMRMEWAKADARARRWEEDKMIVMEEMRRTCTFLDWKANWWLEQRGQLKKLPHVTSDIEAGVDAYAERQANIHRSLGRKFA